MLRSRVVKVTKLPKNKDAQVDITARAMVAIVYSEAWNQDVFWLTSHARLPLTGIGEVPRVFENFVRRRVRFELDPENLELVRLPSAYARDIRRRFPVSGDCDDMAVLLATMLANQGFPVQFVVMATSPHNPEFRHVFTRVMVGREWLALDPSVAVGYDTRGLRTKIYPVPYNRLPPMIR